MGKIIIEEGTPEKLDKLGVNNWGIWEKEESEFPWEYSEKETCYIIEGDVNVKTDEEEVHFGKGDLVKFPEGLKCTWKINQRVKKHYKFG